MNSDGTPRSAQSGDVVRVIMAADVAAWRASLYGDGVINAAEAEVLCRREREAISACPQWRAFYVEALTDFVVRQQPPQGYVTDASADSEASRTASGDPSASHRARTRTGPICSIRLSTT